MLVAGRAALRALGAAAGVCSGSRSSGTRGSLLLPLVVAACLWSRERQDVGAGRGRARGGALVGHAVGRAQQGLGRLLHAHDRRARALEGEQPDTRTTLLAQGKWIDDVRTRRDSRPNPEEARRQLQADRQEDPRRRVRERRRTTSTGVASSWRDHPGEKAKLAGQARAMVWDPRDDRVGDRVRARTRCAQPGAAAVHGRSFRARARSASSSCRRRFVGARGGACSPTRRWWRWASSARRVTGSPWDFLLALLAAAAIEWALRAGGERRMRVVHVHRIRGIGGSERHLLTLLPALAERGVEPGFLGLDDPARAPEPFYGELDGAVRADPGPRDLDLGWRGGCAESRGRAGDRPHAPRARRRLRRARRRAAARLDEAQRRPVPRGPFRYVERALARRASRVIAITEALRAVLVERVGLPAAKVEVVHYGLDALPAPWGRTRRGAVPTGARVLLCVCAARAAEGRRRRRAGAGARSASASRGGAGRARRGAGARGARGARARARRPVLPAGPRRRRRGVVPARRAARPPGALGGLRAGAARGDAGGEAGGGDAGQLDPGDRRRRRDGAARAAGRRRTRPGRGAAGRSVLGDPAAGGARWAKPALRAGANGVLGRARWPSGPLAVYRVGSSGRTPA